jgi:TonB family protein
MKPRQERVDVPSAWIIRRAARGAPADLAERLEEEWLADLGSRRSVFARWRLALGCLWASRVITHDFLAAGVTARATTGNDGVVALGMHSSSPFSRRSAIFVLIAGLHVVLIYALASGFAVIASKKPTTPATGVILPPVPRARLDPPPMIEPKLTNEQPVIPRLTPAMIDFDPPFTPPAPPGEAKVDSGSGGTAGTEVVRRVVGGPGAGFPDPDEYYPPAAIREQEQGAAAVQVCVNEQGKLNREPSLAQSSGFALLDEGALKLAKAGSGHYRTTTENGQPVSDCYSFRVRFRLKR